MLFLAGVTAALAVPSGLWSATTGFAVRIGAALGTFGDGGGGTHNGGY